MKKKGIKTKFRVTFYSILLIITSIFFLTTVYSTVSKYIKINNEIKNDKISYKNKLSEEEELKSEINKLQDPEYVARYAREKYLYSKDGELIIRIPDEDN